MPEGPPKRDLEAEKRRANIFALYQEQELPFPEVSMDSQPIDLSTDPFLNHDLSGIQDINDLPYGETVDGMTYRWVGNLLLPEDQIIQHLQRQEDPRSLTPQQNFEQKLIAEINEDRDERDAMYTERAKGYLHSKRT